MKDYANLFPKKYLPKPKSKLEMIRGILRSGAPQSLMIAAIILVVEKNSQP